MTSNHFWLLLTAAAAVAGIGAGALLLRRQRRATSQATPLMLTVDDLRSLIGRHAGLVLDVRTPADFDGEQGHIASALNLPVEDLPLRLAELGEDRDQPIAIVCRTDRKAAVAAALLTRHGFTAARAVQGGMTAWRERGWPTERSAPTP